MFPRLLWYGNEALRKVNELLRSTLTKPPMVVHLASFLSRRAVVRKAVPWCGTTSRESGNIARPPPSALRKRHGARAAAWCRHQLGIDNRPSRASEGANIAVVAAVRRVDDVVLLNHWRAGHRQRILQVSPASDFRVATCVPNGQRCLYVCIA